MSEWFAIVDAARHPNLHGLVSHCRDRRSLFAEPVDKALAPHSPYLAALREDEPLLPTWRQHGMGQSWGVMVEATVDLDSLQHHLRQFMRVKLPDGSIVLFRFYDPRVLRVFLSSAPQDQLAQLFEGILQFVVEGEDSGQHEFRFRHGRLFDGEQAVQ